MDNEELKKNITSGNHWMRLLYMVLFVVLLEIAGFVMLAVVILQFLFSILSGGPNDNLRRLGDQIASFVYQTLQFLVYNTEEKPFPFAEWPESDIEDLSGYESAEEVNGEVVSEDDEEPQGQSVYDPISLGAGKDEGEDKPAASTSKGAAKKSASGGTGKGSSSKSSSSKSSSSKSSSTKSSGSGSSTKSSDKAGADKGKEPEKETGKDDDSDK
ncbi:MULTISPECIES: DUF4389 domain-containing protein [Microbulbifer]|uniref:DUF4389 domain-containing protein n=1 Tax=Microbulbifer TaxID=48073 RepID=UPI001E375924|nr:MULTISPECIES: DUF4389 domain-containing protein [Microbulbifer]UHQ54994.1 DUF4389 domain-containing protein [Microbulbifer sp. YPW16]